MQKYLLTFWVNDGEPYEGGIAVRRLLLFLRQLLLKYWITKCLLVRRILANFATLFNAAHIDGIRGERERLLGVWEREREWIIPFPKFGNGKGIEKTHSLNSGTGREWKKSIPKIREWEGNEKIYSQNSGTGREWKKSIPTIREWESEAIIPKNSREREWKNITWQ